MHAVDLGREAMTLQEIVTMIGKSNPVILDVGCNDGEHTRMFLSLFPAARLFCFEPDPRARARFVQDDRALLSSVALGAEDGMVSFYQSNGWPGGGAGWDLSGSIRKPKNHLNVHPWCTFGEQIDVQVARLDSWAEQNGIREIDFIWADVQGAEGDLITGGRRMLARTRYFYTEYNDGEMYEGQPTLDQLRAMLPNFAVECVYSDDVLFRRIG